MIQEPKRRGRKVGMTKGKLLKMNAIVDFVRKYQDDNGYAPTLSEIAAAPEIYNDPDSFGNVSPLIDKLVEAGFLTKADNGRRTIAVTAKAHRVKYYEGE